MERDRVILHCDMNSFFASVELLERPELKDKPVAVCGDPDSRHGIILAKNELAKKAGVATPEPVWQALKKCPDLVLVKPHYHKYKHYFHELNKIYQRYTDMVEPFSIDESWLDVTNSQSLFGTGKEIADEIRETVKRELGLTLSVGVSFNKIFAKMGSDYKKPDATTVITRENYKELLWPLPSSELFFCGKKTAAYLESVGIKTIGDIANTDPKVLTDLLGKSGRMLYDYTNGLDASPVNVFGDNEKPKSVGHGVTFSRDLVSMDDIVVALTSICDEVSTRVRRYKMKGNGVKIEIKDPKFKSISRQKMLYSPTSIKEEIYSASMELLKSNWKVGEPIRLITVTLINLVDEDSDEQINLFSEDWEDHEKGEKIARTMDEIREKFGKASLSFAAVLDNDIGADRSREEEKEGD